MCGISGVLSINRMNLSLDIIKKMTDSLIHRGPDDFGYWTDENNITLGHRRLSILDLSIAGKQPMHFLDRYTITFNGEIYNYIELKKILISHGYNFYTNTDTEVILALFDFKKYDCLEYLDGMFAFAIWDKKCKKLFCARDRFGEKPFYYYKTNNSFVFASEIKALWQFGASSAFNEKMLFNYFYFDSVCNPSNLSETFYENIKSLEPRSYLVLNENVEIEIKKQYWDIDIHNINDNISLKSAKNELLDILQSSVNLRLRSDVPIGSSLSGGLDSSTIVALIKSSSTNFIENITFSARFPGFIKDESKYIDIINNFIGTKSYSCFPNYESFLKTIDKVAYHQEEPFGSASILAQYEVMKLAKENGITVMLDGQGADEVFCGYHGLVDSYFLEIYRKSKVKYFRELKIYSTLQSNNKINNIYTRISKQLIKICLKNHNINRLQLFKASAGNLFNKNISYEYFNDLKKYKYENKYIFNSLNEALYHYSFNGSLQELLRYADRNSMANSIEVRLPFLSHRLVEYIFKLPATFKFRNGYTKYILRETMSDKLPSEIIWRKDKIAYEVSKKKLLHSINIKDNTTDYESMNENNKWKFLMLNEFKLNGFFNQKHD
jgi:asparagine synthase (glutamine-hydrolysing)